MNDQYIKRLAEERAAAYEAAKAIVDQADAEGRSITPEEEERFDRFNAEISDKKRLIEKLEQADAAAKVAETVREARGMVAHVSEGDVRSDAQKLAQLFRGEIRSFESGPESRALSTPGGSAIATTFYDQVMVYERTLNPILNLATVLNTTDGAPITLPRLTADVATGGTVTAEAAGIAAADPTISAVTLGAWKFASITLWSRELDEDSVFGVSDLVARSVARDLSLNYGAFLTTGTGTVQPWGIITRAGNGGTAAGTAGQTASDTFFGPKDLVDLMYKVAAPYRQNGTFLVSTTAAAKIRSFRDSSNLFMYGIGAPGQADTFLGRPVVEVPDMSSVGSAAKAVAFGDVSRYFVRRTPLRVEVSDQYGFSTDQLAIKTVIRLDGDLVDTASTKYLVCANT